MIDSIKNHFTDILESTVLKVNSVSGGSISSAFKINTESKSYFLKLNSGGTSKQMFDAEVDGLNAISQTKTIKTPSIIAQGKFDQNHYLLLEFIESKSPSSKDFQKLGEELAKLHEVSSGNFGWETDNFIGSLPQPNKKHSNWAEFYYQERLLPQFKIALKEGLLKSVEIPQESTVLDSLNEILGNPSPSLIHGDLWGGNYLISTDGDPYLIDPAVYFGHAEVDIAMSKLFGGFGSTFYESYFEIRPPHNMLSVRIELYQLYYLLVHLNLFGSSYYGSVKNILKRYF